MTAEQRLAVIIPYYQREAGILRRALLSILAQDLPDGLHVHVFVIDDASPHPAGDEMSVLPLSPSVTFSLHTQPNGGPGAARNTGLDMVAADGRFDFVAFLDSDDTWTPAHLREAVEALDRGYDFYFCDNGRDGVYGRYSDELAALCDRGAVVRSRSDWSTADGPMAGFPASALTEEMVAACLCHTSAVVITAALVVELRFDPDLRSAGEDHLFWLAIVLGGARTIISWNCNVICGRGVNIFFSAFDWNTQATLDRIGNLAIFGEKLSKLHEISPAGLTVARQYRNKYRRAYAFLISRAVLKRQPWHSATFDRLLRIDPIFPFRLPFLACGLALDRNPEARKF